MKKIKGLFVAAALLVGVGTAFAFVDDPLCQQALVGYSQPIDNPAFIIPGQYGAGAGNYSCNTTVSATCRYVKKPNGTFVPCDGQLVRN